MVPTHPIARHLHDLLPHVVDPASDQITSGLAANQVEHFYSLLITAVDFGKPDLLDPWLQGWVKGQDNHSEPRAFHRVLNTIKAAIWRAARDQCPPEVALEIIQSIESYFSHAHHVAAAAPGTPSYDPNEEGWQRLEKSKSDFVAVAAHELRTPLALLEAYAKLLAETSQQPTNNATVEPINGIAKGIARLQEIVDNLVDASLIDNEMLALSYQPVRLSTLVQYARDNVSQGLQERHLTFDMSDFTQDDLITADPQRLLQVFRNLVQNAVKYTPDYGRISVSAQSQPSAIDIHVQDTGIGIPIEHQHQIFDRFAPLNDIALHSSSKTRFRGGGMGLGLAIARGIVEAHAGNIWCESPIHNDEKCPGTTFHLILPRIPPVPEAAHAAQAYLEGPLSQ